MTKRYNILFLLLFTFIHSQYVQVAPEIATAGAFLGGRLGTHAIHSNPALLGIQTGEFLERSLVDTFTVFYSVKLAQSTDKKELLGSYFKQKSKFFFVYSCPQYIIVSFGKFFNLFRELNICSCVPSKTLPHPKENNVSPQKTTFSSLKCNAI